MDKNEKPALMKAMSLAGVFLFIALFLMAMGTFLAPLLAVAAARGIRRKTGNKKNLGSHFSEASSTFSLDVLIPAHNEPQSLPASIEALQKIRANAPASLGKMQIFAGLSHWTGPEALNAARDADVVLEISEKGKWRAIQALVEKSTADWIALVDAGVVWEQNSLKILTPLFLESEVIGVNPRFQELKGGRLQKIIWALESRLKLIENKSGGPISLHGATIFYRREHLQQALRILEGTDWLNDDVVVPLTLRSMFPEHRLVYTLDTSVTDLFPSWDAPELQRRKRLLLGNIQWVHRFYWDHLRTAPVVALLAKRRLARMVWAWWFASLVLAGIAFTTETTLAIGIVLAGTLGVVLMAKRIKSINRLLEAFWISLAFPVYFLRFVKARTLPSWK